MVLHRVLHRPDPLFPSELHASRFDEMCGWLRRWFNVLPLEEAVFRWVGQTLPARALAITFDDGYADNYEVALPILERHRLTATFFVTTGFLDGGRMWNDTIIEAIRSSSVPRLGLSDLNLTGIGELDVRDIKAKQAAISAILPMVKYLPADRRQWIVDGIAGRSGAVLPNDLMMRPEQVRALHQAGMTIGAHTVNHPILAGLSDEDARFEMNHSKEVLEDLLGVRVGLFAYPNGKPGRDYTPAHAAMVQDLGFDAAFSTAWGAAGAVSNRYELPRFTPWDQTRIRFGLRMWRNLHTGAH